MSEARAIELLRDAVMSPERFDEFISVAAQLFSDEKAKRFIEAAHTQKGAELTPEEIKSARMAYTYGFRMATLVSTRTMQEILEGAETDEQLKEDAALCRHTEC